MPIGAAARPMNIDRNSSTPSYVQVAEYLKLQILAGTYLPGSRLPAEAELIRQSQLSRVTVRKGLGLLEVGGWIVRKQGLGAFVRGTINQELSSAQTITEVMVEGGITPRIKMLSFAAVTPAVDVAAKLRPGANGQLLLVERLYLKKNEPIALVQTYLPLALRDHARLLTRDQLPPETTYTILEKRAGLELKEARHTIRAARADAKDAECLDLRPGDPILILERLTYGQDGSAVEYTRFHYHPDRYEFSLVLPRHHTQPL
jgi:GntR family transcriptional regulator